MATATTSQIQANIDALNDAVLQLAMGKLTASILFDGRKRTFVKTDMATINGLTLELKAQLAQSTGAGFPRRGFQVQF